MEININAGWGAEPVSWHRGYTSQIPPCHGATIWNKQTMDLGKDEAIFYINSVADFL